MNFEKEPYKSPIKLDSNITDPLLLEKLENLKLTPHLVLDKHLADDNTCAQLAQYIKSNDIITNLAINDGNITGNGLGLLSEVIAHSRVLTTINFSRNKISDVDSGLSPFFLALQSNLSIENLDLSFNNLGRNAAFFIADVIKHNLTIRTINLRNNHLDSEGCKKILISLESNPNLQFLYLENNDCDKLILIEIDKFLARNRQNPRFVQRSPIPLIQPELYRSNLIDRELRNINQSPMLGQIRPNIIPNAIPNPPLLDNQMMPFIPVNRPSIPLKSPLVSPVLLNPNLATPPVNLFPRAFPPPPLFHPLPPPDFSEKFNKLMSDFKKLELDNAGLVKLLDECKAKEEITSKGFIQAIELEKSKYFQLEIEIKNLNDLLLEKDQILAVKLAEQKAFYDAEILNRDNIILNQNQEIERLKMIIADIETINSKLQAEIISQNERMIIENKRYDDLDFLLVSEKKIRSDLEFKLHGELASAEKENFHLKNELNALNLDANRKIQEAQLIIDELEMKCKEYHIELTKVDALYREQFERANILSIETKKIPLLVDENAQLKRINEEIKIDYAHLFKNNHNLKLMATSGHLGNVNKDAEIGLLRAELANKVIQSENEKNLLANRITSLHENIIQERDRAAFFENNSLHRYLPDIRVPVVPVISMHPPSVVP